MQGYEVVETIQYVHVGRGKSDMAMRIDNEQRSSTKTQSLATAVGKTLCLELESEIEVGAKPTQT